MVEQCGAINNNRTTVMWQYRGLQGGEWNQLDPNTAQQVEAGYLGLLGSSEWLCNDHTHSTTISSQLSRPTTFLQLIHYWPSPSGGWGAGSSLTIFLTHCKLNSSCMNFIFISTYMHYCPCSLKLILITANSNNRTIVIQNHVLFWACALCKIHTVNNWNNYIPVVLVCHTTV